MRRVCRFKNSIVKQDFGYTTWFLISFVILFFIQFHEQQYQRLIFFSYFNVSVDKKNCSVSALYCTLPETSTAVSYTHLDVYKRQGLCRPLCYWRTTVHWLRHAAYWSETFPLQRCWIYMQSLKVVRGYVQKVVKRVVILSCQKVCYPEVGRACHHNNDVGTTHP